MRSWTIGDKIDAIRSEYESYDFTRADAKAALLHLGLTETQARQILRDWRKEPADD